ncbi:hypothetical protein JST97_12210 [bacterium]|nr:hypothetical protein [bacterium]
MGMDAGAKTGGNLGGTRGPGAHQGSSKAGRKTEASRGLDSPLKADQVKVSAEVHKAQQMAGTLPSFSALAANLGVDRPEAKNGAVESLRGHLGTPTADLKGILPGGFSAAGGKTNNCADTVTSALKANGQFDKNIVNVKEMEREFKREGIKQIPADQAMPGDVWISESRKHTELVSEAGGGMTIGSNNQDPITGEPTPGKQFITERPKDVDAGVYYDLTP